MSDGYLSAVSAPQWKYVSSGGGGGGVCVCVWGGGGVKEQYLSHELYSYNREPLSLLGVYMCTSR